jgi:hypothetical protein
VLSRCSILILTTLFLVCSTIITQASAQDDSQDPAALLDAAAQTMLELDSFHFLVSTPLGKTMLADQVELSAIEGDVVRPASFRAQFTVELGFVSLNLSAIGIGSQLWVSDPTQGDDQYVELTGAFDETLPPQALLNPDRLVMLAVSLLKDPVIKGTVEIDGTSVVNVEGTFDPNDLESLGTPVPDELLSNVDPLTVNLWIDEEDRIRRAEFAGALLPSEQDAGPIVRRVDLSAFNEPVTIEPPEVAS